MQTETWKASSEYQETLLYREGDQTPQQVVQAGGGFYIFGYIQKSSGSEQVALGGPARARGLVEMTSRDPCQPQPFCDLVILSLVWFVY